MGELYLCFVKYIGKDVNDKNEYEFIFSEDKDDFWITNGEYKPMCLINNDELVPEEDSYSTIKILKTDLDLDLCQDNCCFSFTDVQDNILPLGYENIDNYEEYPQDGRLVLMYGDSYENVLEKLSNKNLLFE